MLGWDLKRDGIINGCNDGSKLGTNKGNRYGILTDPSPASTNEAKTVKQIMLR